MPYLYGGRPERCTVCDADEPVAQQCQFGIAGFGICGWMRDKLVKASPPRLGPAHNPSHRLLHCCAQQAVSCGDVHGGIQSEQNTIQCSGLPGARSALGQHKLGS